MVSQIRIARPKRRAPRLKPRAQTPRVEAFEPRLLLASSAFLQGIVTVSGTSQPLAGATVLLQSLDSPRRFPTRAQRLTPREFICSRISPAAQYRITETPPSGYVNDSAQPNSPLTPILNQTSSTIDVQLSDPSQLLLSYPSHNKENLTSRTMA